MKTLITALGFAIVVVAPGFPEPADARATARNTETADSCAGKTRNVIGGGNAPSSAMKIGTSISCFDDALVDALSEALNVWQRLGFPLKHQVLAV